MLDRLKTLLWIDIQQMACYPIIVRLGLMRKKRGVMAVAKKVCAGFAILILILSGIIFACAEGRNVIEFAQLYMNRVDNYYEWDGENALDFSATDIQSTVIGASDNTVVVKCLAGNATVNTGTFDIDRLDTIPFIASQDMTYLSWCGKCIVAMSALEYDTAASRALGEKGEFSDAVQKCLDIWNNQVNISAAFADAQNGIDVLIYDGEKYHYYLHYEKEPMEAINIIASVEELNNEATPAIEDVAEDTENASNETDPAEFVYGSDGAQVRINSFIGNSQDIVIPSTIDGLPVTMIGEEAFKDCKNITSVIIPEGVTEIGADAFYGCKNLSSVVIPTSLTYLSRECFMSCYKLTDVKGMENIRTFGSWCFHYSGLSGELVFNNDTHIMWGAFNDSRVTGVKFISGKIEVECSAFNSAPLRYCYIDEGCDLSFLDYTSATKYGAFYDCEKMTDIIIPASVDHFPPYTFEGCKSLTVYTPAGSTAEQYAKENFVSVNTSAYESKVSEYRQ